MDECPLPFDEQLRIPPLPIMVKNVGIDYEPPATKCTLETNRIVLEESLVTSPLRRGWSTGPYRGIKFEPYTLSWFDRFGAWAKKKIGAPIYWWPLSTPIYPKEQELIRMSWKCSCGAVLSSILPMNVAEQYQRLCAQEGWARDSPNIMSGAPSEEPTGSFSTTWQTSTDALPGRPSAVLARNGSSLPTQRNITTLNVVPTLEPRKPGLNSSTFILCCIGKPSNRKRNYRTVLSQLSKTSTTNDKEFFQALRSEYRRIKGWRRWISLYTIGRIRPVKFVRYLQDYVDCYNEELPLATDHNYEYVPRPPTNPPVFPAVELMHYFEYPNCAGTATDCLDLMPGKVTGKLVGGVRVEGWGIQTRENLSSLRLGLLLLSVWLGTAGFAAWWLIKYQGDLQNAFTPANYATSLAVVCIIIPEALTFYSGDSGRSV